MNTKVARNFHENPDPHRFGALMLLLLITIFLAQILSGCNPIGQTGPGSSSPPASKQLLQTFFRDNGVQTALIPATSYYLPSADWVEVKFSQDLAREQVKRGVAAYDFYANNCTHFARTAAEFAGEEFFHDPKRPPEQSIAFGVFWYLFDTGDVMIGGHAINVVVMRDGDKLKMRFFEPQQRGWITLSQAQIESGVAIF